MTIPSSSLDADAVFIRLEKRLLKRQVDALRSLPTFPESVLRLNHEILFQSDNRSFSEIARLIETDPVLTARILRLVNSAFYNKPGLITHIQEALVMLGLDIIRGVILSTSALEFAGVSAFDGLWEHSFGVAVASRLVAETTGMEKSEDVAAAGLLHDLGKLILLSQLRDDYEKVVAIAREKRIHIRDAELEVLGVSHDVVGHWLMKRWRIPDRIAEPVIYHHRVDEAETFVDETYAVHLGNALTRAYGFGFAGDESMPDVSSQAIERFGLDQKALTHIVESFHQTIQTNPLRIEQHD